MNNRQIAHLWAQQESKGRRGSNFFFDGATIYSYGSHFPIARFVSNDHGERAVLFTTRDYSVTTQQHKSHVRGALHGLRTITGVFHVHDVTARPQSAQIRGDYLQRVTESTQLAARARKYAEQHIECAQHTAAEGNAFAEFCGWSWRLDTPTLDPAFLAQCRERIAADHRKRTAEIKKREAEYARALAESIVKWRGGENVYVRGGETMLRVLGDKIQTSRGAEIPLDHAPRVWGVIRKVMDRGEPYQHNGHAEHAGEFRIDRIDVDGTLHAGCHVIGYAELARMAQSLGLAAS